MAENFFSENDLKNLFPLRQEGNFESRVQPKDSVWKIAFKFICLFVGIFVLTFSLVNFSAISKNLSYFWNIQIKKQPYQQVVAAPTPTAAFNSTSLAQLVIPKINVNAPIVWNVEESQINDRLLEGVVHFQDTALPGQKGNIFITGHSSYYSWASSDYKDVFALLGKLSTGDQIFIQYQDSSFTYIVSETKVVPPEDLSVLDQTPGYNLTLMTCVPIGTNLNRLIIRSIQAD